MRKQAKQWFFVTVGCISLVLGLIGIPLPLLPTTPFLLLSAICFAKGSERLHSWLMNHAYLGPPIHQWQEHRAISRQAKWLGTVSLLLVIVVSLLVAVPWPLLGLQVALLLGVAAFLWSRPEPPADQS